MVGLISVVVPVGRVDDGLRTQLHALVAQQAPRPFEVVLARNTDDAAQVAALDALVAAIGDARVRAVDAADRRGASHARNAGAKAAEGEVLAFCDADDVVHEGWVAAITGALEQVDAAGGRLVDIGLSERHRRARPPATPEDLPTFLGVPYMGSGNMAIGHHLFDDVGGFDEALHRCEDIALSWTLIASGRRIGFASDAVVDYHHRPGTVPMLEQHFAYGKGMAQVLVRYGVPTGDGWSKPKGLALLRPNPQATTRPTGAAGATGTAAAPAGPRFTVLGVLRRGSLAVGRVWGVAEASLDRRRSGAGSTS